MARIREIDVSETLTHVALEGRLDVAGVDALEVRFNALTVARGKPAIVDLSSVEFIASLGIGMLLRAAKALDARRSVMVLCAPAAPVEHTLRASSIDKLIPVFGNVEEARSALKLD
jgi:anti-anti-sigma factor